MRNLVIGCSALAAIVFAPAPSALAAGPEPTLLWQFAQHCLWAQQNGQQPDCESVGKDASGALAYVIKKDIAGDWQFLLIPTVRITGIESPALVQDSTPNYLAYAWEATDLITRHRGVVPRQDLALAVNSAAGRSMNQLHIHIDCIRLDVRQALHAHDREISANWLSIADAGWPDAKVFGGHHYQVRWVDGPTLFGANVFRLVADRDADTGGNMALQTIVVVGAASANHRLPGFYILTDRVHVSRGNGDMVADDAASGEELMGDHQGCPALAVAP